MPGDYHSSGDRQRAATNSGSAAIPPPERPVPPEPPISTAGLAARLGSSAPLALAAPQLVERSSAAHIDETSRVGSVLELVRISLPSAIAEPIVDIFIILQAVGAAFVSGVLALAWPAAVLLLVVLVQAARRWRPSRLKSVPSTALFDSMG